MKPGGCGVSIQRMPTDSHALHTDGKPATPENPHSYHTTGEAALCTLYRSGRVMPARMAVMPPMLCPPTNTGSFRAGCLLATTSCTGRSEIVLASKLGLTLLYAPGTICWTMNC